MWLALQAFYGDSSTWDDGKFKEDEPKKEAHECVEHNHNLVTVEDCSTSWSSDDDDDRSTTSSLDKVDDDATSVASVPHAHLMVMMVHAQAMMKMLLQALQLHHHIASCHKVTPR